MVWHMPVLLRCSVLHSQVDVIGAEQWCVLLQCQGHRGGASSYPAVMLYCLHRVCHCGAPSSIFDRSARELVEADGWWLKTSSVCVVQETWHCEYCVWFKEFSTVHVWVFSEHDCGICGIHNGAYIVVDKSSFSALALHSMSWKDKCFMQCQCTVS